MFACLHVSILAKTKLSASGFKVLLDTCFPNRGRYKKIQLHSRFTYVLFGSLLQIFSDRVVADARNLHYAANCYAYRGVKSIKKTQNGIELVSVHTPT
jgi:hypothetical protein